MAPPTPGHRPAMPLPATKQPRSLTDAAVLALSMARTMFQWLNLLTSGIGVVAGSCLVRRLRRQLDNSGDKGLDTAKYMPLAADATGRCRTRRTPPKTARSSRMTTLLRHAPASCVSRTPKHVTRRPNSVRIERGYHPRSIRTRGIFPLGGPGPPCRAIVAAGTCTRRGSLAPAATEGSAPWRPSSWPLPTFQFLRSTRGAVEFDPASGQGRRAMRSATETSAGIVTDR
jgi:hypothetical protein